MAFSLVHPLIDLDHFVALFTAEGRQRTKNFHWIWNFKAYYTNPYLSKPLPAIHPLHTIEVASIMTLAFALHFLALPIFLAFAIHMAEDLLETIWIWRKRLKDLP